MSSRNTILAQTPPSLSLSRMHRQASTTRVADLPKSALSPSPKKKAEGSAADLLPLYSCKREISGSDLAGKLIHLVPVVVLLCLFVLWCCSYPVNLEMKNGRIAAAYRVMKQNTPLASVSEMQMAGNNG